jgi:sugar lactone lactonase YvrE
MHKPIIAMILLALAEFMTLLAYLEWPHQISVYAQTGAVISTVVGSGSVGHAGDAGLATSAQLDSPNAVKLDANGNLYISEILGVRKVTAGGVITTVAGGTGMPAFNGDGVPATSANIDPQGVAVDNSGNIFISDAFNHRVRKVASSGIITTIAGNGNRGSGGDGGPATAAQLDDPRGIAVDATGNVYVADYQAQRVRKISPNGVITTVAGTGSPGNAGDGGPATSAQLSNPIDVVLDVAGNLLIADLNNRKVRKVSSNGLIQSVAGYGGFPFGVSLDSAGSIYISDSQTITKIAGNGALSAVAGIGTSGFSGDGGAATSAQLYLPRGIAVDPAGTLFIADMGNHRIRRVTSTASSAGPLGTTLTLLSASVDAAEQPRIGLVVNGPAPANLTGTVRMTFQSSAAVQAADPAIQFSIGGTMAGFNIPAGSTQAVFSNTNSPTIGLQAGTVTGTITFSCSIQSASQTVAADAFLGAIAVLDKPPTIRNITVSGAETPNFSVVITGYSTSRQVTQVQLTFRGTNTYAVPINVNVGSVFNSYYQSSISIPFGSLFRLVIPFTTGGASIGQGQVTATLTNRIGVSQPALSSY